MIGIYSKSIKLLRTNSQLKSINLVININNHNKTYDHITTFPTIIFDHKINKINNFINFENSNIDDLKKLIHRRPIIFIGTDITYFENGLSIVIFRKQYIQSILSLNPITFLDNIIYNYNKNDKNDKNNNWIGFDQLNKIQSFLTGRHFIYA